MESISPSYNSYSYLPSYYAYQSENLDKSDYSWTNAPASDYEVMNAENTQIALILSLTFGGTFFIVFLTICSRDKRKDKVVNECQSIAKQDLEKFTVEEAVTNYK